MPCLHETRTKSEREDFPGHTPRCPFFCFADTGELSKRAIETAQITFRKLKSSFIKLAAKGKWGTALPGRPERELYLFSSRRKLRS